MSGHSLPEGASPFPTGERLRIRRTLRLVFGVAAERRGRRSLRGKAADSPNVYDNLAAAAGGVGTPPPTRPLRVRPFLPPAGEGGIRRSPARRMTEEGERDRQQTGKSFAYAHGCDHFHIAVPSRSPSPAALVGGTLPRWGREGVRGLWMISKVRRICNRPVGRADPGAPHATPRFSPNLRRIRTRPFPPLPENGPGSALAAPPENRNGQDPAPQAWAQRPCLGEESCLFLFGLPVSPYTGASSFSGWRKTPPCPDTPARRRARPRCAGAGCTWPPGRCGWGRRS